jgi:hypothetical protein
LDFSLAGVDGNLLQMATRLLQKRKTKDKITTEGIKDILENITNKLVIIIFE